MVEYGRKRQNGSCPVERGRSEEVKAVRNGLRWEACLPTWAKVISGPSWVAAPNHVWIHGPAASVVCVNVHGSCYCHRP